jgi:CRISPR-associated protein (TIGR03986 family)
MPSKPDKPHRIRVRTLDGKPRDRDGLNKLKSNQLGMPHLDIVATNVANEFIICASKETHIEQARVKLGGAGLEEISAGDTSIAASASPRPANTQNSREGGFRHQGGSQHRRGQLQRGGPQGRPAPAPTDTQSLRGKPYGFVPLPDEMTTAPPVWHDGSGAGGRLSGEIRCEIKTLTPLLVGWERRQIDNAEEPWPVPHISTDGDKVDVQFGGIGRTTKTKSVLCPLRAPWDDRPVLIPGDSIKGLLRHELGALLGAPMERVAERSYSYRPNSLFPNAPNPRLVARLARVADDGTEMKPLDSNNAGSPLVRVPVKLDLLPRNLKYDRKHEQTSNYYRFDNGDGAPYRGGQGAGERLNSKRNLHKKLEANPTTPVTSAAVSESVQAGYLNTLRHLVDSTHGHFSERHPDVPTTIKGEDARNRILHAASNVVFQPGDMIWVEWDTQKQCIVSLGWHYYYRWAYIDTVRKTGWINERRGLFPLGAERAFDDEGAPAGLSAVRRLFGYTGDDEGSAGIGRDDHAQLMGRLSVNAAIEVVEPGDATEERFLPPTFLKELGMPRPSAVEHYLEQPHYPNQRPSDRAQLVTYGDAAGYDQPGRLAGRKFYLDRKDAYAGEPWKDDSEANRLNDRSTLALEASGPGRRFRFTVRFRDLDPGELAAVLAALCPDQFRAVLGGGHADGYCSKLGYARPLGWGSVRIEAKALLLLDGLSDKPALRPVNDLPGWMRQYFTKTPMLQQWLTIHRHKHPDAADYPRGQDGNIYSYHTKLRAEHSRARRYNHEGGG